MLAIEINQFEGYDVHEFTSFLEENNDDIFEIFIPKDTTLFYSSNNDLAWEFAIGAYVGEILKKISTEFSYTGAPIATPDRFSYRIKTKSTGTLAVSLLNISSVFGNSEISEPIDFACEISAFLEDPSNKEVACKDLFDIALEYAFDNGSGNE